MAGVGLIWPVGRLEHNFDGVVDLCCTVSVVVVVAEVEQLGMHDWLGR